MATNMTYRQNLRPVVTLRNLPYAYLISVVPLIFAPLASAQEIQENSLLPIETSEQNSDFHVYSQDTHFPLLDTSSMETWTTQTLLDLVERYACLEEENINFESKEVVLRAEFAAALNSCLENFNRQISNTFLEEEDTNKWQMVQDLSQNNTEKVNILGQGVNDLEERVKELEDVAFSTTTKFIGEAIFAYSDLFIDTSPRSLSRGTGNGADLLGITDNDDAEAIFGGRGRLTLHTSFSGDDRLLIRATTSNLPMFDDANELTGRGIPNGEAITGETTQTFNIGANTPTFITQNLTLAYSFPVGDSAQFHVFGSGGIWSDFVPTLNPYFEDYDGGNGALSTFASSSPIYRIGGGSGFGLNYDLNFLDSIVDSAQFSVGYLAPNIGNGQFGLFDSDYSFLMQTNFQINKKLALGLTYNHAYHPSNTAVFDMGGLGNQGVVGSQLANTGAAGAGSPKITNSYGAEIAWQPLESVALSAFFAYTDGTVPAGQSGDYEIWTYGLGVAFPSLAKDGDLLGFFAGAQPYVAGFDSPAITFRNDVVPYHFELFYRYPINEFISITPGVIFYTAPNQIDAGASIFTLRTTFKF